MFAAGALSLSAVAGGSIPAHAAALKADGCSLHVSIPHPHARQVETLTVGTSVGKTRVQVKIKYKTTSHTWDITTAGNRKGTHRFNVGHPTKGYRVKLSGKVIAAPKGYKTGATCSTSFVPV
jgi:hypothetical protein